MSISNAMNRYTIAASSIDGSNTDWSSFNGRGSNTPRKGSMI